MQGIKLSQYFKKHELQKKFSPKFGDLQVYRELDLPRLTEAYLTLAINDDSLTHMMIHLHYLPTCSIVPFLLFQFSAVNQDKEDHSNGFSKGGSFVQKQKTSFVALTLFYWPFTMIFLMSQPRPLFIYYLSFQSNNTILQQINVKIFNPTSGVGIRTQPPDYESPPLTTRPELPFFTMKLCHQLLIPLKFSSETR